MQTKAVKPYLYYLELKNVEIMILLNVLNFFPKSDGGHCEYYLNHTKTHRGHPATFFFYNITVRRSKYYLGISKAWEKLKISG